MFLTSWNHREMPNGRLQGCCCFILLLVLEGLDAWLPPQRRTALVSEFKGGFAEELRIWMDHLSKVFSSAWPPRTRTLLGQYLPFLHWNLKEANWYIDSLFFFFKKKACLSILRKIPQVCQKRSLGALSISDSQRLPLVKGKNVVPLGVSLHPMAQTRGPAATER